MWYKLIRFLSESIKRYEIIHIGLEKKVKGKLLIMWNQVIIIKDMKIKEVDIGITLDKFE